MLLRILCTLPITSAKRERLSSTLRRLKTYLRATMTSERESGLALMNIHYGRKIGIGAAIAIFARKHPRRLLLSDILAEWTVNHNSTLSPTEGSHEIALRLRELSALLPSLWTDCLFCPAKTWFLPHTMPPDSPTKTSKEIHVEIHPVLGETFQVFETREW